MEYCDNGSLNSSIEKSEKKVSRMVLRAARASWQWDELLAFEENYSSRSETGKVAFLINPN